MSDNLSSDAVKALLEAIKEQAEGWQGEASSVNAASSLKDLAEAYAWIQRPIRGTAR